MRRKLLTACIFLFFYGTAQQAAAATADDARQFVDNVGKRVLEVINGGGSEEQKQQKLRQMFAENVDIPWMGKFVLGAGWNKATDEQKNRYMEAYKQYLLARYTSDFADYTDSKYTITGAKGEDEGQFLVTMQIKSANGKQPETNAGYRVHAGDNGQFMITDIIVEGVSLISTERTDFASVYQQQGIDKLIQDIEAKTQDAQKKSSSKQ